VQDATFDGLCTLQCLLMCLKILFIDVLRGVMMYKKYLGVNVLKVYM
jgi:hypothetical protein